VSDFLYATRGSGRALLLPPPAKCILRVPAPTFLPPLVGSPLFSPVFFGATLGSAPTVFSLQSMDQIELVSFSSFVGDLSLHRPSFLFSMSPMNLGRLPLLSESFLFAFPLLPLFQGKRSFSFLFPPLARRRCPRRRGPFFLSPPPFERPGPRRASVTGLSFRRRFFSLFQGDFPRSPLFSGEL